MFAKSGSTWTLTKSCTLTKKPLVVPDGVTLDGGGNTLTLSGKFPITGYVVTAGSLHDLTIDGSGLPTDCTQDFADAIGLRGTGRTVADLTVRNIVCGPALLVDSGSVTISYSTVEHAHIGLVANIDTTATVDSVTVTDVTYGFFVAGGATLSLTNCTIQGADGTGPIAGGSDGVLFDDEFGNGAGGSVNGCAISGFNGDFSSNGCGIEIDAHAGTVTLGTNSFPNPPGNQHDICDHRA